MSEEGLPVVTWGSLKDLPSLDEVFSVVDKLPEGVEFPREEKKPEVKLPETDERKQIKKWLERDAEGDEGRRNHLYALKSPNGNCIVEFGGYFDAKRKREDWLRSIDPKTNEILWKYDEPGLTNPGVEVVFALEADIFLLSDVRTAHSYYFEKKLVAYPPRRGVKVFSCRSGLLFEYMKSEEEVGSMVAGILSDKGKDMIIATTKGTIESFDTGGHLEWQKKNEYSGYVVQTINSSPDGTYLFVDYHDPQHAKKNMCCDIYRLLELKTGKEVWSNKVNTNLGDKNALYLTNTRFDVSKDGLLTGIWLMDYKYASWQVKGDVKNPYDNILLLVTHAGAAYAFRIESFGFAFSSDGKYLAADGKYYSLQLISGEGRK